MSPSILLYDLEGATTVQASAESVRCATTMKQGVGWQTDWLVPLSSDEAGWCWKSLFSNKVLTIAVVVKACSLAWWSKSQNLAWLHETAKICTRKSSQSPQRTNLYSQILSGRLRHVWRFLPQEMYGPRPAARLCNEKMALVWSRTAMVPSGWAESRPFPRLFEHRVRCLSAWEMLQTIAVVFYLSFLLFSVVVVGFSSFQMCEMLGQVKKMDLGVANFSLRSCAMRCAWHWLVWVSSQRLHR